eukprot:TRINITY_DN14886_c0_g1_i1.p1 TRINITY_DN14886_c0_g1~~TRINITY_DN14886_c0_g1_i1.p1  ORF type:complete len:240 (+),score=75.35 TRINITY_DN14886_c0_g1_i1:23-721(+)
MVQLAVIILSPWLVSLVLAQDTPSSFSRQRVVWQEQIDKVKMAEEQLKQKSMPAFSSKSSAQEMLSLSAIMSKSTDQDQEFKTDMKDAKPVKTKPVSTFPKPKSSYILEAERFLREFRQRKTSKTSKPVVSSPPKAKIEYSSFGKSYEGKSKYLEEAERILKDIHGGKKYPVRKTLVSEEKRADTLEEKKVKLEKKKKLGQNEIKDILIENIGTKEGLKEIIKVLLKQTLGA